MSREKFISDAKEAYDSKQFRAERYTYGVTTNCGCAVGAVAFINNLQYIDCLGESIREQFQLEIDYLDGIKVGFDNRPKYSVVNEEFLKGYEDAQEIAKYCEEKGYFV